MHQGMMFTTKHVMYGVHESVFVTCLYAGIFHTCHVIGLFTTKHVIYQVKVHLT